MKLTLLNFLKVNSLKNPLKYIYATARTVHQLLGELGSEFERQSESVISFANRIRDIGSRILETQKLSNGGIDNNFKVSTEASMVECFRRGLRPEIESRIEEGANIKDVLSSAIKVERQLEAQKILKTKFCKA